MNPVEVPSTALSPEALKNLIESFILREGTDYGAHEIDHDKKVLRIYKQLESGNVKIIYDPSTESITLLTDRDWHKLKEKIFNTEN